MGERNTDRVETLTLVVAVFRNSCYQPPVVSNSYNNYNTVVTQHIFIAADTKLF